MAYPANQTGYTPIAFEELPVSICGMSFGTIDKGVAEVDFEPGGLTVHYVKLTGVFSDDPRKTCTRDIVRPALRCLNSYPNQFILAGLFAAVEAELQRRDSLGEYEQQRAQLADSAATEGGEASWRMAREGAL